MGGLTKSAATLSGDEGVTALRIPGEMFPMLGQSLPGTKAVDLAPTFSTENEASNAEVDVHVFKGDAKLVAYIASISDQTSSHSLDFSKLLADTGAITMTRLGVVAGQNHGFHQSTPNVSSMDPDQALSGRTSR